MAHMWRTEDNLWASGHFFYLVRFRDPTQDLRLGASYFTH